MMKAAYWLGRNRLYLQVTNRLPPGGATTLFYSRGPNFQKTLSNFHLLDQELTAEEMAAVVDRAYETDERKLRSAGVGMGEEDEGVCFAGVGEPLLRLETVLSAVELIKEHRHGVPLSLSTTGLGVEDVPSAVSQIAQAGLDRVSIFIPSANPAQYQAQMGKENHLGKPCEFLTLCVEHGLSCRVVTVSAPNIDTKAVRDLSSALGAVDFDIKPYFA